MFVGEALVFFKAIPMIAVKLKTLQDVGLDYITLGQNATTLSGGEAQRIKLSKELSRRDTGVLHHLVELGNSVVVIEHNLDMVKNADYIIDMGPEGGNKGGKIIATGSPETLASTYEETGSYTGEYLVKELGD
jgi:excinuclease ABC subunit A